MKRNRKTDFFCVRLPPPDLAKLDRLARETNRSMGGVIRQLLYLADSPEGRKLLGTKEKEVQQ